MQTLSTPRRRRVGTIGKNIYAECFGIRRDSNHGILAKVICTESRARQGAAHGKEISNAHGEDKRFGKNDIRRDPNSEDTAISCHVACPFALDGSMTSGVFAESSDLALDIHFKKSFSSSNFHMAVTHGPTYQ